MCLWSGCGSPDSSLSWPFEMFLSHFGTHTARVATRRGSTVWFKRGLNEHLSPLCVLIGAPIFSTKIGALS